jgi:hypothetical protein
VKGSCFWLIGAKFNTTNQTPSLGCLLGSVEAVASGAAAVRIFCRCKLTVGFHQGKEVIRCHCTVTFIVRNPLIDRSSLNKQAFLGGEASNHRAL